MKNEQIIQHPTVSPSAITTILDHAFRTKRSVFLIGAPGIGKTNQAAKFAKQLGHAIAVRAGQIDSKVERPNGILKTVVASTTDRLDWTGIPFEGDGITRFAPSELVADLSNEKNPDGPPTLLYLNELNSAPESVFPVLMRLVNERAIDGLTIRDNVLILADGNPVSDSFLAHDIAGPLQRRFRWFMVQPNFYQWRDDFALPTRIHPDIIAFLTGHPNLLLDFDGMKTRERLTYASPAGWECLSHAMAEGLLDIKDETLRLASICGDVGTAAGHQFNAFQKLRGEMPDVDFMLANPEKAKFPKKIDLLALTVSGVFTRVRDKHSLLDSAFRLWNAMMDSEDDIQRDWPTLLLRLLFSDPDLNRKMSKSKAAKDVLHRLATDPKLKYIYDALIANRHSQ